MGRSSVDGLGCFIILVSWLHGLFYYYTITPNYMNIQKGLTEAGEQVDRAEYTTRIDTSDFCERLGLSGGVCSSVTASWRKKQTQYQDWGAWAKEKRSAISGQVSQRYCKKCGRSASVMVRWLPSVGGQVSSGAIC